MLMISLRTMFSGAKSHLSKTLEGKCLAKERAVPGPAGFCKSSLLMLLNPRSFAKPCASLQSWVDVRGAPAAEAPCPILIAGAPENAEVNSNTATWTQGDALMRIRRVSQVRAWFVHIIRMILVILLVILIEILLVPNSKTDSSNNNSSSNSNNNRNSNSNR